jgi:hypothetical protein
VSNPSPQDVKILLEYFIDSTFFVLDSNYDRAYFQFQTSFVFSGDSARNQWALVIADTIKANRFAKSQALASSFNPIGTTTGGGSAHWSGLASEPNSLYGKYLSIFDKLRKQGFKQEQAEAYANVVMFKNEQLGVKLQKKVGSNFKELDVVYSVDPVTGKISYRIIICR